MHQGVSVLLLGEGSFLPLCLSRGKVIHLEGGVDLRMRTYTLPLPSSPPQRPRLEWGCQTPGPPTSL